MASWFQALFKRSGKIRQPLSASTPDHLALSSENQSLRLELAERDHRIERLMSEVERLQAAIENVADARLDAERESIIQSAAPAIAQLLTQAYLLEEQGRPIRSIDLIAVSRRLIKSLEGHGLEILSSVGQQEPFDPNRHMPLDSSISPELGQPVVIRFSAIAYRQKILRKAGVEIQLQ